MRCVYNTVGLVKVSAPVSSLLSGLALQDRDLLHFFLSAQLYEGILENQHYFFQVDFKDILDIAEVVLQEFSSYDS